MEDPSLHRVAITPQQFDRMWDLIFEIKELIASEIGKVRGDIRELQTDVRGLKREGSASCRSGASRWSPARARSRRGRRTRQRERDEE
jgi:hypothetical protein